MCGGVGVCVGDVGVCVCGVCVWGVCVGGGVCEEVQPNDINITHFDQQFNKRFTIITVTC